MNVTAQHQPALVKSVTIELTSEEAQELLGVFGPLPASKNGRRSLTDLIYCGILDTGIQRDWGQ